MSSPKTCPLCGGGEMSMEELMDYHGVNDCVPDPAAIFDILVLRAGAAWGIRPDFIYQMLYKPLEMREYRFQGALGFGGKLYVERVYRPTEGAKYAVSYRVDCYPEDMNDERKAVIENTNWELAELTQEKVA